MTPTQELEAGTGGTIRGGSQVMTFAPRSAGQRCPDCGAQMAADAAACPRCGWHAVSVSKDTPAALTLTFAPDGDYVRWESAVGAAVTTPLNLPAPHTDLALLLRALDVLQSPNYPVPSDTFEQQWFVFSAVEQQRLARLGLWGAGRVAPDAPRRVGQALFAGLVTDPQAHALLYAARVQARQAQSVLHLMLRFPAQAGAVAALPWELLWEADALTPLLADAAITLTRRPDRLLPTHPAAPLRPPLHILAITPHAGLPADMRAAEHAARMAAWQPLRDQGLVTQTECTPARLPEISDAIARRRPDIIHYYGHGLDDNGVGRLLLDGDAAAETRPDAGRLAALFQGARLVVLHACRSAAVDPERAAQAGVALALNAAGVPFVIGMQATIGVAAAVRIGARIYSALAAGAPVPAAVSAARRALFVEEPAQVAWFVPALYG